MRWFGATLSALAALAAVTFVASSNQSGDQRNTAIAIQPSAVRWQ